MFTGLILAVLVGAALSLVGLISAFRAWLGFRRTRRRFEEQVVDEVARLSIRANELERGVNELNRRASELPIRVSDLQRSIAILQTLSGSLAVSLRQARRILTFAGMKTASASAIGDALRPLIERTRR